MCLQKAVVETCGCRDIALPGHEKHPQVLFCNDDSIIPESCTYNLTEECPQAFKALYDRIMCVKDTIANVTSNPAAISACECYPPCEEISYDVSYSLSKWPSESFDGEEAYIDIFHAEGYPARFNTERDAAKLELYGNYFDPTNRREAMKDFARLNVYIADSNVVKIMETEDYSHSQLLSDLGGQLGLWVGISVITLVEVLELILDGIKSFSRKHGPCSKGKSFSKTLTVECNPCQFQGPNGNVVCDAMEEQPRDPYMMI
jgi:hypothetical protein